VRLRKKGRMGLRRNGAWLGCRKKRIIFTKTSKMYVIPVTTMVGNMTFLCL